MPTLDSKERNRGTEQKRLCSYPDLNVLLWSAQTRDAGLGERLPGLAAGQDRGDVQRRRLLSVHGHALPRLHQPQEGQVRHQPRARVHTEL